MKILDLLEETYSGVTSNKVRSGLTVLGIVIGIGSVIAMIAIGKGAQESVQSSIQSIGSNLILINPGFPRSVGSQVSQGRGNAQTLKIEDAEAIEQEVSEVAAVSQEQSRRYQIVAQGKNTNTQVVGVVPEYLTVRNLQVETGNFFTQQNLKSLSKVAVLGPTTASDLFGEQSPLGQTIRINKIDFKVIGVSKSKGGSGFNNSDDMVFVPLTSAQKFLSGDNSLTNISIQVKSQEQMSVAQTNITQVLLQQHKISNPQQADFQVLNQSDIVAAASSVTNIFTILLSSIASISLLVGGIGIMNMMLTTVKERTREIGLRKAIGAYNNDISKQFLLEAMLLTLFGGVFGIVLGWLLSFAISRLASINTSVTMFSVFLAVGVSAGIGVIFGYYPAYQAAKLRPIEALKYE